MSLKNKKNTRIYSRFAAEMTRRRIYLCWRFCLNEKKRWNEMDRLKLQGKTRMDGLRLEWKSNTRERERERERERVKKIENITQKVSNHSRFNWVGVHSRKGSGKFKFLTQQKWFSIILCGWFFYFIINKRRRNCNKTGSLSHFDELDIFCGCWSFSWLRLSLSLPNRPRTAPRIYIKTQQNKILNKRKVVEIFILGIIDVDRHYFK